MGQVTPGLTQALHADGFALIRHFRPGETLGQVARSLGEVMDPGKLLGGTGIPTVQVIRPRPAASAPPNQYSSEFGLAEFPFHTDLAHWSTPPRYLLLRALKGCSQVTTYLMHTSTAHRVLGEEICARALFRPRKRRPGEPITALPLRFEANGDSGSRWDQLFLRPINAHAERARELMLDRTWQIQGSKQVALANAGDALLIDNWRCLHARSAVGTESLDRALERVYLSSLAQ